MRKFHIKDAKGNIVLILFALDGVEAVYWFGKSTYPDDYMLFNAP